MYEQPPPYSGIGPDPAPHQLTHRRVNTQMNSNSMSNGASINEQVNPTALYSSAPPPYPQAESLPQKKFD